MKYTILGLFVLLFGWMVVTAWLQPGVADLEGNFREIVFVRNEQNTGPVVRYYAVSLQDTLWQQMQQYGDFMPHTKYGKTAVYFFLQGSPVPDTLTVDKDPIPEDYKQYCIGKYEKDAMGQVTFSRFPFWQ